MTITRHQQEIVPTPGPGDSPDNEAPPSSPLIPASMHRAERDAEAAATSPEFNERPARETYTAPRATADPRSVHPAPPDIGADDEVPIAQRRR